MEGRDGGGEELTVVAKLRLCGSDDRDGEALL